MALVTKLSELHALMAAGQWDNALCMAAKWQQLGTEAKNIRRAADAIKHPAMYMQMRRDVAAIKQAGIAALQRRYLAPKPSVKARANKPAHLLGGCQGNQAANL